MTSKPKVAVAIPAYNESEGIAEFLLEIDEALQEAVESLTLVVVDDASLDDTIRAAESVREKIGAQLEVTQMGQNSGHGLAMLEAYRQALNTDAELILAVDGDGQFLGTDLLRVVALLQSGVQGVCGVRRYRYDPWFRMIVTRVLRVYIGVAFGIPTRDANCPLRGYSRETLDELMQWIPQSSTVPNIHLAVLAARRGTTLVEVDVNHRVRRGASITGTMFNSAKRWGTIKRLSKFSIRALGESWRFRHDLNAGRRPMTSAR